MIAKGREPELDPAVRPMEWPQGLPGLPGFRSFAYNPGRKETSACPFPARLESNRTIGGAIRIRIPPN
jgi:hypothetical protein